MVVSCVVLLQGGTVPRNKEISGMVVSIVAKRRILNMEMNIIIIYITMCVYSVYEGIVLCGTN